MTFFPTPDPKKTFPSTEEEILAYWKENDVFQRTIDTRSKRNQYTFFDGPPFATGTPHYGHILAGTIKDVIPRYWTMKGYRIERRFGWDCHGVPVEFQVEKEHNIGGKPGIEKMGVGKFNELCRSIVLRCRDEWESTVERMGRFVDFHNDYKTMDPAYMESVWWVFRQLWDKGLIYEGEKVVPYSPKLGSPLSNFEAGLNYKDIDDPAVTVKFELEDEPGTYVLAWTTTPWTLPSNLGLCVNEKVEYVKVKINGYPLVRVGKKGDETAGGYSEELDENYYIVSKNWVKEFLGENYRKLTPWYFFDVNVQGIYHTVIEEIKGSDLKGKKYKPLFPSFEKGRDTHEVVPGHYFVTFNTENGEKVFTDEKVRVACAETFREVAEKEGYRIFDLAIMPDHVHLTLEIWEGGESLEKTLQQLKWFSSWKLKQMGVLTHQISGGLTGEGGAGGLTKEDGNGGLTRGGGGLSVKEDKKTGEKYLKLWRKGYDKKFIYNEKEYANIHEYIKDNPGKEGLSEQKYDWLSEVDGEFPEDKRHQIFADPFVGEEDGTGIVHLAPTGEDDARILTKEGVELVYPFTADCYFDFTGVETHPDAEKDVGELQGLYFRKDEVVDPKTKEWNANKWVIKKLQDMGLVFDLKPAYRHSYPHCWRTDCALMYRGVKSWFVNIQKIKKELIKQNKDINWIPEHLRDGRFGKGLENAPDWAISRNRYWGAPLPVWKSESGKVHVIGSRAELEELSGQKVEDLHKHFVDDITFKKDGEVYHRIPEVLDCWFESGSMPYASQHYPFSCDDSNLKDMKFEPGEFKSADFIAEGLDQTRGWFYTLHVLGVALFGKNIYKNVVTNGIVLAEDGQKMSKSKKNYPDPSKIFNEYGADAMRFYLMGSPAVRGENLRFSEHGVAEVTKSLLLPLRSAYQFFSTYANIDGWTPTRLIAVRHGEGDHNIQNVYSGKAENDHHLTDLGRKQVEETARKLPDFDVLISSPFLRTRETAEIVKSEKGFEDDIVIDKRARESEFGKFEGKAYKVCFERWNTPDSDAEDLKSILARGASFLSDMVKKHKGKTVVVCTHGDFFKSLKMGIYGEKIFDDFTLTAVPQTGDFRTYFPQPDTDNPMDCWILSEMQTVCKNYRRALDAYNLDEAVKSLVPFLDKLNNWYLRRNRKRFWASGLGEDKSAGYETLHYVLRTFSLLLAPVCPFYAEQLWRDMGGLDSVHLEYMPAPIESWINTNVERNIGMMREIVGLSASIRARAKIKLRQPLGKLQFAVTGGYDLDLDIIREEANVKEVEVLKTLDGIAQQIIKVDAKKVGPRLGAKVQELIAKGKAGEFKLLDNGQVEIAGEILELEEYEKAFLCEEGIEAEATARCVVLLDTEVHPELEVEGMAREIIRSIQALRKENGFEISDRISVVFATESQIAKDAFTTHKEMIAKEVLASDIKEASGTLVGESTDVDGEAIGLELKKV